MPTARADPGRGRMQSFHDDRKCAEAPAGPPTRRPPSSRRCDEVPTSSGLAAVLEHAGDPRLADGDDAGKASVLNEINLTRRSGDSNSVAAGPRNNRNRAAVWGT